MKNILKIVIKFLCNKKTYIAAGCLVLAGVIMKDIEMILAGLAIIGLRASQSKVVAAIAK